MIVTKVSVVVEDKERILLLKEWSNKRNGYFWNLIKGTFGDHEGETLEDCAKREAQEEAGIDIEIDKLISCYVSESNGCGIQFNFLAHLKKESNPSLTNKDDQIARGEDITEFKWFTKNEVSKLTLEKFINNRIYKVIGDWQSGKRYSLQTISQWN